MPNDNWNHLPLTDLSYQILLVLAHNPLYGYGILRAIADRTDGRVEPDTGTLYTAIRRLHRDKLLEPVGGQSAGQRGRSYRLTALGERIVRLESRRLADLVAEARRLDLVEPVRGVRSNA